MFTESRLSSVAAIRLRAITPCVIAALLGAGIGDSWAQDLSAGQLDTACAARCAKDGGDGEFCGRVCWVPDPGMAAKAYEVDYPCYKTCRDNAGKAEDCLPACRMR